MKEKVFLLGAYYVLVSMFLSTVSGIYGLGVLFTASGKGCK